MRTRLWLFLAAFALSLAGAPSIAQDKKDEKKDEKKKVEKKPSQPPTTTVAYGKHPRQVIDFYQVKSDKPTPLMLFIHGGGWRGGDKNAVGNIKVYHDAGISVAAINYRYVQNGVEEKVEPPVKAPLDDAARALQFIRSKSSEWNLDKRRIGATGSSAGACSSLWLAFHDDMADPKSSDPIARESTRLYCAAVTGAQTTLDPKDLLEWLPNYIYGAHAFGMKDIKELSSKRESVLKWIKEYSPSEHATKDDPPIGLYYKGDKDAKVGATHPDPTHSPVMGMMLEKKLKSLGVEVAFAYTDHPHAQYPTAAAFMIGHLKK